MRSDFSFNTIRKEKTYDVLLSLLYKDKTVNGTKIRGKSDKSKQTKTKRDADSC